MAVVEVDLREKREFAKESVCTKKKLILSFFFSIYKMRVYIYTQEREASVYTCSRSTLCTPVIEARINRCAMCDVLSLTTHSTQKTHPSGREISPNFVMLVRGFNFSHPNHKTLLFHGPENMTRCGLQNYILLRI